MKRLQILVLFVSWLSASSLYALSKPYLAENPNYLGNQSEWDTFAGFDFKQSWIPSEALWKPLVTATAPGIGFYGGQRVHPYIAWELGYGWGIDKSKNMLVPANTAFAGVLNTGAAAATLKGRLHLKTAYADLNILLPLNKAMDQSPELVFSVGVAMIKPALNISVVNSSDASLASLSTLKGSTHGAARVGLGIQSFLVGNVGMRLMWRFENTQVLRINNVVNPNFASLLRNGQSVSLGLFMRL
ncbi:MAG: hypothetical protein KA508_02900 [Gammaproteobacteria bacterium]|nr:hypothetical protein [Gammaproteobacteria bacterium]